MLRVIVMLIALTGVARADRIVLTRDDPELLRALEASLDAAGIAVELVFAAPPLKTTDTLAASRELAAREGASAVIWVMPETEDSSTILVFDGEMDRILVRPLAHGLPLDAEDAAAAASMVRTMLRAIRVTPDVDVAPPRAEDAAAVRAAELVPEAPEPPHRFAVELGSLAQLGSPRTAAWALTGRFAWYPGRIGIGISVAAGPTGAVDGPGFEGQYGDLDAAVLARWPAVTGTRATLEVAGGAALHLTSLDGTLMDSGTAVDERRVDPAARIEAAAILKIGASFGLVMTGSMDAFVRRQRYLVGSDEVVATPRISPAFGLHLRVLVP